MPSSLNADNGVVSGTAGLKSSADSSGVLDLQTNGTTAISISASQVVSFANQPTYTGGTANGVLYLNGSKVVTSGSALTFDGTNLGVGGAPTNYAGYKTITLDGGTAGAEFDFKTNGTLSGYLESTSSLMKFHVPTSSSFVWNINTEQMRLTSTGLGIGTSSPESKLAVKGSSGDADLFSISDTTVPTSGAEYGVGMIKSNSTEYMLNITSYNANGKGLRVYHNGGTAANYAFYVSSFSGDRLILDGVGNLGLGVTPSAWGGDYKAIQFSSGAISSYQTSAMDLYGNAYDSGAGAWKYLHSSIGATRLASTNGQFQFYNAPVGTAGNAITFTQAMTLDASGNLGVGTTSISSKVYIAGATNDQLLRIGNTNATGTQYLSIYANGADAYYNSVNTQNAVYGSHVWNSQNNGGTVERARIDSSGNLLVGTTNAPNATFLCKSNFIGVQTSNPQDPTKFRQIAFSNDSANAVLYFYSSSNTASLSAAGAWTNASDARLKNSITDIKYGLADVLNTQPRSYKMNDLEGDYIGFVAQELQTVIPEVVSGYPENQLGVDYGSLVAVAFKAIQEQQAIIESLKARLDAANL